MRQEGTELANESKVFAGGHYVTVIVECVA